MNQPISGVDNPKMVPVQHEPSNVWDDFPHLDRYPHWCTGKFGRTEIEKIKASMIVPVENLRLTFHFGSSKDTVSKSISNMLYIYKHILEQSRTYLQYACTHVCCSKSTTVIVGHCWYHHRWHRHSTLLWESKATEKVFSINMLHIYIDMWLWVNTY